MEDTKTYYSQWYTENRERLLPIRKKYNKEYSKRPYVIAKAKSKNMKLRERRQQYKKTTLGKEAEKRYREKHKDQTQHVR